jgi:hypothetical protein
MISLALPTCIQAARLYYMHRASVRLSYIRGVTADRCIHAAGKDTTQAFYGLHRHEILLRPQYARLQIGTIQGEETTIKTLAADALSEVPYAEPTWLSKGYHSPYYGDSHRRFQRAVRKFMTEVVFPEAVRCEENGKRISQEVVDQVA